MGAEYGTLQKSEHEFLDEVSGMSEIQCHVDV